MSTLITKIENASARVTNRMTNEFVPGVMTAIAASATTTMRILAVWLLIERRSFPTEQSGRFDRKDQRHRCVKGEIRHFGEQRLAEIVGEADGQRADRGAAKAAHAADDHHCERERQHFK